MDKKDLMLCHRLDKSFVNSIENNVEEIKNELINEFNVVSKIVSEHYTLESIESEEKRNRYLALSSYRDGIRFALDRLEKLD